jgi:hypothetical protein
MTCPHLEYRDADVGDEPRAFCTVVSEFVQPMRADICNDRYELHHAAHCEIYREREREGDER